jgi:6-phosphofructokinase 1
MAKRIGVLTAGGDAPGLNVCLKAVVYNAIDRGYEVIGIRKGWEGLLYYDPKDPETHLANVMIMTKPRIRDIDRTAGSFLHSSRLDPHQVSPEAVPSFLQQMKREDQPIDLTDHIKRVLEKLQLEALVRRRFLLGMQRSHRRAGRAGVRGGNGSIGVQRSVELQRGWLDRRQRRR